MMINWLLAVVIAFTLSAGHLLSTPVAVATTPSLATAEVQP